MEITYTELKNNFKNLWMNLNLAHWRNNMPFVVGGLEILCVQGLFDFTHKQCVQVCPLAGHDGQIHPCDRIYHGAVWLWAGARPRIQQNGNKTLVGFYSETSMQHLPWKLRYSKGTAGYH